MAARAPAAARPAGARAPRRLPSPKTAIIAAAAYIVAIIFILPYVAMLITALRPQNELLGRDYLPHHFNWSVFTNMWGPAYGLTSSVWNEFITALTLTTNPNQYPLTVRLDSFRGAYRSTGSTFRRLRDRHYPGAHPVRPHRGTRRRRPHRRLDQVSGGAS